MTDIKLRCWQVAAKVGRIFGEASFAPNHRDAVLMYHAVGEPAAYGNVTIDRFRTDLEFLTEMYEVVDLHELLNSDADHTRVAITFDDAYENVYQNAIPILRRKRIPVTVYAVAEFIGGTNKRYKGCDIMAAPQLRELSEESLVTVGNHTLSHPRLADISDQTRIEDEILGGKKQLEDILGTTIKRFSYPYGSYNDYVAEIARTSHTSAVTTVPTLLGPSSDPATVPRLTAHNPPAQVRWELTDIGDSVRQLVTRS